ncbi:MAG: MoaD/ThiS family protein [Desulfomonile tiedjei]|uniref:MoaD/ThiS family protein n=1 Tax=Desulfomonile tiedjei TaxID=2358 RepID=A0A9D6UZB2_9BACT|nr:MoaD/ThiS family protein [Desulfomonile tiedjei]
MKIELGLYASLSDYLPSGNTGHRSVVEIDEGISIQELLSILKIPRDNPKIMFLNGIHATGNEVIKDGDRVAVFPPIAGG